MAFAGTSFYVRLLVAYVFDWAIILATIGFAGSTSLWATPNIRPFDPLNQDIGFPFQTHAKIPTWLLVVLAVVLPAAVILLVGLFVQKRTAENESYADSFRGAKKWKRKAYLINTAWLGLGLSIATAMIITDGIKNIIGRPRPDMLSRCDVDFDLVQDSMLGPAGLVGWEVCRNRDVEGKSRLSGDDLRDGFRSFPSGHSSLSFAGLGYLTFFIAQYALALPLPHLSRPPIVSPVMNHDEEIRDIERTSTSSNEPALPSRSNTRESESSVGTPPLPKFPLMFAFLLCAVPVLLAAYIAATRFSDFRHHAFDILFGSSVGLFAAYFGWRWYGAWSCQPSQRVYRPLAGRLRHAVGRKMSPKTDSARYSNGSGNGNGNGTQMQRLRTGRTSDAEHEDLERDI